MRRWSPEARALGLRRGPVELAQGERREGSPGRGRKWEGAWPGHEPGEEERGEPREAMRGPPVQDRSPLTPDNRKPW